TVAVTAPSSAPDAVASLIQGQLSFASLLLGMHKAMSMPSSRHTIRARNKTPKMRPKSRCKLSSEAFSTVEVATPRNCQYRTHVSLFDLAAKTTFGENPRHRFRRPLGHAASRLRLPAPNPHARATARFPSRFPDASAESPASTWAPQDQLSCSQKKLLVPPLFLPSPFGRIKSQGCNARQHRPDRWLAKPRTAPWLLPVCLAGRTIFPVRVARPATADTAPPLSASPPLPDQDCRLGVLPMPCSKAPAHYPC